MFVRAAVVLCLSLLLTACGGGKEASDGSNSSDDSGDNTNPPTPEVVTVSVTPGSVSLYVAGTQHFTASVSGTGDTAVTWKVQESSGCGSINTAGDYTAPRSLSGSSATCHVIATSHANQSVTGTAVVTVNAQIQGGYITPDSIGGDVTVAIDSHVTSPISPYVFGVNDKYSKEDNGYKVLGDWSKHVPLSRVGGNTTSTIDWRTGYTQYSNDWNYWNNNQYVDNAGRFGGPTTEGSSFKLWAEPAFADNTAMLWTVPMLPFVAGDDRHPDQDHPITNENRPLDWLNPNRAVATDRFQTTFLPADPARVRVWEAHNPNGATATPAMTGTGYADDLIKWLTVNYPSQSSATGPRIMVSLDNEPDNWSWDYGTKHGWALGWGANLPPDGSGNIWPEYTVRLGHDYFIDRTVAVATAVKDVDPNIDVFGGVFMGYWGLYSLGNLAEPGQHPGHGVAAKYMSWPSQRPQPGVTFPFLEMWLDRLNTESQNRGARIVDVLDTHFYHNAFTRDGRDSSVDVNGCDEHGENCVAHTDDTILHARMQSPRAFWDPDFHSNTEIEWKAGQWGLNNVALEHPGQGGVPLNWIDRLKATVQKYEYGPQKLAITEYQLGRAGDISGAVAQADVLGVFAREGIYAATYWSMTHDWAPGYRVTFPNGDYDPEGTARKSSAGVKAAFNAWVDYDGQGAGHGDTYAQTTVQDANRPQDPNRPDNAPGQTLERVTAYATYDAANPGRMVIIATNKTVRDALNVGFQITHTAAFKTASVYRITGGDGSEASITGPIKEQDIPITATNALSVSLPAKSITVIALSDGGGGSQDDSGGGSQDDSGGGSQDGSGGGSQDDSGGGSNPPSPTPVTISIAPGSVSLHVAGTQHFTASVSGTSDTVVTWSLQESSGCGSISAAGDYTAPAAISGAAIVCHVVATSHADSSAKGTASVYVSVPHAAHIPAMRLISRGAPAYASAGTASDGNSSDYQDSWTASSTDWLAYDLSQVSGIGQVTQVMVNWTVPNVQRYDSTWDAQPSGPKKSNGVIPGPYVIEGSANSTNGATGNWTTLFEDSAPQQWKSRTHLLSFNGYTWVRFRGTGANPRFSSDPNGLNLHFDVWDASSSMDDSWVMFGDSITGGAWRWSDFPVRVETELATRGSPARFPLVQAGGIAFMSTWSALADWWECSSDADSLCSGADLTTHPGISWFDHWLSLFPGKYIVLAYGTNDTGGGFDAATFRTNYKALIDKTLAAGKVPVIPSVIWNSTNDARIQQANEVLGVRPGPVPSGSLKEEYGTQIVNGPDLYGIFRENTNCQDETTGEAAYCIEENGAGLHPTGELQDIGSGTTSGYGVYRDAWAQWVVNNFYQ